MADKTLRRQLYDHLCARIRGESDVEATKRLILETRTSDRGYWIVVEQAQLLLPPSGPPKTVAAESRQLLARCMIFLRTEQDYQWEIDGTAGASGEGRGRSSVPPTDGRTLVATALPAALLGAAAVVVWVMMGWQWIAQFYALSGLAVLWLLLGYARYRRKFKRSLGDIAVWPFYDRPTYEAYLKAFGPLLAADTGGGLKLEAGEGAMSESDPARAGSDNAG